MRPISRIDVTYLWEPEAEPFCGPLYFGSSVASPLDVTANGTFGLVDTGKKRLLVTCYHVWHGFQELHEDMSALKMFICPRGDKPVVLDQQPLAYDTRLDLVTFDATPLLSSLGRNKFYRLDQNRPPGMSFGGRLFMLGYPGRFRSVAEHEIRFGRVTYAVSVASVDGPRFHSDISSAEYEDELAGEEAAERHPGISGAPCFFVKDADRPLQLVGFATSLAMRDYLGFVHARCIGVDGIIHGAC